MHPTRHHILSGGVLCMLVAGCAPEINEYRNYDATLMCDGTAPLHVRFGINKAILESNGTFVSMTQRSADKGVRYAGSGQSLVAQGLDATWTDGKGAAHQCRQPAVASPAAIQWPDGDTVPVPQAKPARRG
jgi:hypothetical protein